MPNAMTTHRPVGRQLKLDYATLYAEVLYRQERLRDEKAQGGRPGAGQWRRRDALGPGRAVRRPDLPDLPPFFSPAQRAHCLEQSQAERVIAEPELAPNCARRL
jgi:hypothetical protein